MQNYDQIMNALMPRQRIYHLFVSHSWDYGDDRDDLGSLIIKGLNSNHVYDNSAPENDPIHAANQDDLIIALIQRISQSHVLIFPAGVYASYSKWIPTELAIAQALKKPIIAVEKWGAKRTSSMVQASNEVVGWSSTSVANAINRWHPLLYVN